MYPYLITPPPLYAIVSFDKIGGLPNFAERLLNAKIEWIQLRNKEALPLSEFIQLSKIFLKLRDDISPLSKIIINDHPHIAENVGADGVHLGQSDMDPIEARKILGENAIIGLSTNNLHQALSAPIEVLSYLACGPVFHSSSKSGHAVPIGLDGVLKITSSTNFPFVAIGGVNLGNAGAVFQVGAKSVAMIGELLKYKDSLDEFKQKIEALIPRCP